MIRSALLPAVALAAIGIAGPTLAGVNDRPIPKNASLPDLVPLPPFYVEVGPEPRGGATPINVELGAPSGDLYLRFSTAVANFGEASLDLFGVPSLLEPDRADAYQCVAWTADRACRQRADVGTVIFHPDHGHFHFEDFASYVLRRLDAARTPDFSPAGLVVESPKVSFCLQDFKEETDDASLRFYRGCSGAVQGISPGWSDVYAASLAGQGLPLTGVSDGEYALVFTGDPGGRLYESDRTNNVAWGVVRISEAGTRAEIVEA